MIMMWRTFSLKYALFHFLQREYNCNCYRNTVYNVIASPHVVHHRVGRKKRMSSLCPFHLRGLRTISLGIETEQLTFDRLIDYRWSTFDFSKIHYRQSIFKLVFKKILQSTIDFWFYTVDPWMLTSLVDVFLAWGYGFYRRELIDVSIMVLKRPTIDSQLLIF